MTTAEYKADRNKYMLEYNAKNKERISAQRKARYLINKEKVLLACKEYRTRNKEAISVRTKNRYNENKDIAQARIAAYKARHEEAIKAYQKKYKRENPDYFKESARAYARRACAGLYDSYVKSKIKQETGLSFADIPQELIESTRLYLMLIRQSKNTL